MRIVRARNSCKEHTNTQNTPESIHNTRWDLERQSEGNDVHRWAEGNFERQISWGSRKANWATFWKNSLCRLWVLWRRPKDRSEKKPRSRAPRSPWAEFSSMGGIHWMLLFTGTHALPVLSSTRAGSPVETVVFFFSFSSHSRCEIKRAGRKKKLNFCRGFQGTGSNPACAPWVEKKSRLRLIRSWLKIGMKLLKLTEFRLCAKKHEVFSKGGCDRRIGGKKPRSPRSPMLFTRTCALPADFVEHPGRVSGCFGSCF